MNNKRYELRANNGQVLEHGFSTIEKAIEREKAYKVRFPEERFQITEYDLGKYGKEK